MKTLTPSALVSVRRHQGWWLPTTLLLAGSAAPLYSQTCGLAGQAPCMSPVVGSIQVLRTSGQRPRFSPDGTQIVYDDFDSGTAYAFVTTPVPNAPVIKIGTGNGNNGNGNFDRSGKFVIFSSEALPHIAVGPGMTTPGTGYFNNLWATDMKGGYWQLTDIPIKQTAFDGIPVYGSIDPIFSPDGKLLVWAEHYADTGNQDIWGAWRLKGGDYSVQNGVPTLQNIRVIFQSPFKVLSPTTTTGNVMEPMSFLSNSIVLVASNQDGQDVYGMDQYGLDVTTGKIVRNFTNTPDRWEEDSSVAPNNQAVYMSNRDSAYNYSPSNPDWPSQPVTREWYLVDNQAIQFERLTYFNTPGAGEYTGKLVSPNALTISPDGQTIVGSVRVADSPASVSQPLELLILKLNAPLFVTSVNGASFQSVPVAPDSIVSLFARGLATSSETATTLPLPPTLAATSVTITDSTGVSQPAPLFYAGPTQINYLVPADTAPGTATVMVKNPAGIITLGTIQVAALSPALFTANSSGTGAAAGLWVLVTPDNQKTEQSLFTCAAGHCSANPVSFGAAGNSVVLELFGTGLRAATQAQTKVTINGQPGDVQFVGPTPCCIGVDQLNVGVPPSVAGAGFVDLIVTVNGQVANTVQVLFK